MLSTIRLIFGTRWARFVLAVVALFCAVGVTASALATSAIKTKIGTIERLRTTTSDSGDYKYDTIQLAGDSASYTINRSQFTPTLNADQLASGEPVTIWYNQSPLNDPSIVAIQMPGASGGQLTRYVTDFYTHPDQSRTSNLNSGGCLRNCRARCYPRGHFPPRRLEAAQTDSERESLVSMIPYREAAALSADISAG